MKHDLPILAEEFINYLRSKKKSKYTITSYKQELHYWFKYLITLKKHYYTIKDVDIEFIKKLKFEDLNSFMDKLNAEGKSPRTINHYVASLQSFFSYLKNRRKLLSDDITKNIGLLEVERSLPKFLTPNQAQSLLNAVDSRRDYERDYAIIKLYLNCGLRLSEAIKIELPDIIGNIVIIKGKGNKQRTIVLNEGCITAINNYLKVRPKSDSDKLFLKRYRGKYSEMIENGTSKMVMKYAEKANLPDWFTTHKLRHTCATEAVTQGVSLLAIQNLLGHVNLETTKIYMGVSPQSLIDFSNKVLF